MKSVFNVFLFSIVGIFLLSAIVDLNDLFDYGNQEFPSYISNDNTPFDNPISDPGATLGRVLFYDVNLSSNNAIACSSCHLQEFAFTDTSLVSVGVNGITDRHSMRLVNERFNDEVHAFWDERADNFEEQATMPIRNHIEMGFSGENDDPDFDSLLVKLETITYYPILFEFVYGSPVITEEKIQKAIAQFIRSIQSYDSRYDEGRALVSFNEDQFPNFTTDENAGKDLYFTLPLSGGAGCFSCHVGDEFSIVDDCANNGVIGVANNDFQLDLENTKPPSLRDLVNPQGLMNGPFMHDGSLSDLLDVVNHYNTVQPTVNNSNLDFRLIGSLHSMDINEEEKQQLIAFLLTLTGDDIYTNEKWSSPFDEDGSISVIPNIDTSVSSMGGQNLFTVFPNPASNQITINLKDGLYQCNIYNATCERVEANVIRGDYNLNVSGFSFGNYIVQVIDLKNGKIYSEKFLKK